MCEEYTFSDFNRNFSFFRKKLHIICSNFIKMKFKPIQMVISSLEFIVVIENFTLCDLRIIKMNRAMVESKWGFKTCNPETKWNNLILPNITLNIRGILPSVSSDIVIILCKEQTWTKNLSQMLWQTNFNSWRFLPYVHFQRPALICSFYNQL